MIYAKRRIWSFLLILAMVVSFLLVFPVAREVRADVSTKLTFTDGTLTVGLPAGSTDTWTETPTNPGIYTLNSNGALIATFDSDSKTLTLHGENIGSAASNGDSVSEIQAGIIWESDELLTIETVSDTTTRIDYGIYTQGPLKISSDGTLTIASTNGGGVIGTTSGDSYAIYAGGNVEITDGATVTAGTVNDSGSTVFLSNGIYSGGTVSVNDGTLTANAAGDDSTAIEATGVSVTNATLEVNAGLTGRTNFYYGITGINASTVTVNAGGTLTVNAAEFAAIGIKNGDYIANVFVQGDNSGNNGILNINTIGEHSIGVEGSNLTVKDGGVVDAKATGDGSIAIRAQTVTVDEGGKLTASATKSGHTAQVAKGISAVIAIILNGGEITASATNSVAQSSVLHSIAIQTKGITLNAGTLTATADNKSTAISFHEASDGFNTTANIPGVSTRFDDTTTNSNYDLYFNTASGFVNGSDASLETTVDGEKYIEIILPTLTDDGKAAFFGANGLSLPTSGENRVTVEDDPVPDPAISTPHPILWEGHVKGYASGTWDNSPDLETVKIFIGAGKSTSILTLYVQGYNTTQSPEGDPQKIPVGTTGDVTYDAATGWLTVKGMYGYYIITEFVPVADITMTNTAVQVNQDLTLDATVEPNDATNQDIVWSLKDANETGATVTESGGVYTFKATTQGTAIITATITDGTVVGTPYTKDFDITVTKPVTNINMTTTTVQAGQNLTLDATVEPNDATNQDIAWSLKDANGTGATVTNGSFTATTPGTAKVTATITDGTAVGTDYTKEFDITVTVKPVTNINMTTTTVQAGQNLTLDATIEPNDATNQVIVWSLKDANGTGATVTNGLFTATTPGTAKVTATITDGTEVGMPYTKDFDITVTAIPTIDVVKDAINDIPDIGNINPEDKDALEQAKDKVDEAIKQVEALTDAQLEELERANPGIIDKLEDAYRDISYLATGTLEIMDIRIGVSASGIMPLDENGNPIPVKLEVTEIADPSALAAEAMKGSTESPDVVLSFDIKLTADGKEIQPNGEVKVTFSAPGYEGKTLAVAHKESSGKWAYFIVKVGADSMFYLSVTEFSPFIVLANPELIPTAVSLDKTNISMKVGEKTTITATVEPLTEVSGMVWASSNTAVATVDGNGVVTAVAKGTAVITVTVGDVSASAMVTVQGTASPETGDDANPALWVMIALVAAVGISVIMRKRLAK